MQDRPTNLISSSALFPSMKRIIFTNFPEGHTLSQLHFISQMLCHETKQKNLQVERYLVSIWDTEKEKYHKK